MAPEVIIKRNAETTLKARFPGGQKGGAAPLGRTLRLSIDPPAKAFGGKDSVKGNRQGSLEVNWPQAKRDRPGPFTSNQTTFEHFFEVFKSPAACRKDFFDKLGRRDA